MNKNPTQNPGLVPGDPNRYNEKNTIHPSTATPGGVKEGIITPGKTINPLEPVILTNDKKTFIHHAPGKKAAVFSPKIFLDLCDSAAGASDGSSVIDRESLKLIQVLDLHRAIDHTLSATGSAVLLRSLIQPDIDLKRIQSKQEALKEIASNDKLRQALMDCVQEFSNGENALYKFFNKGLRASFPYPDMKKAKESVTAVMEMVKTIPPPESSYLNALMSDLHSYQGSAVDQMMTHTFYKTFTGLKPRNQVNFLTPKLRFIPRRFTPWIFAGPAMILVPFLHDKIGFIPQLSPMVSKVGLGLTGAMLFYSLFIKPIRDTETFIEPLRLACIHDSQFSRAMDAVGLMDELLSFHNFAKALPHAAVLPRISNLDHHFFKALDLKNPILAKENNGFIPNKITMNGARLTFLSGPNSGGKTTICKSIVHNQLLAQAGSYVVAKEAEINIAHQIRYQAPKFDGLQDSQGRFGTELTRTRDIFYATSPKSLVILDELAEGTTHEETLDESFEILKDFHTIGNNTILVTHNHSLVDKFATKKKGQCLMVECRGDDPTFKIIPGISRQSHAHKIAEKINFSKAHRQVHMKNKGYI